MPTVLVKEFFRNFSGIFPEKFRASYFSGKVTTLTLTLSCWTWLLGCEVDKSSSPDGTCTTLINLPRKESTVSASIIMKNNIFQESTTRWEKNSFCNVYRFLQTVWISCLYDHIMSCIVKKTNSVDPSCIYCWQTCMSKWYLLSTQFLTFFS